MATRIRAMLFAGASLLGVCFSSLRVRTAALQLLASARALLPGHAAIRACGFVAALKVKAREKAVRGHEKTTNTYPTWSLALPAEREKCFLASPDGSHCALMSPSLLPDSALMSPAQLGVTASSAADFLKALDLGGGDQRLIAHHLADGDVAGARNVLLSNKAQVRGGSTNQSYILTGGVMGDRLRNAAVLQRTFSNMRFAVLSPSDEGRLTIASVEQALRALIASHSRCTHALVVAKGSTDLHLAWLDAAGVPAANSCRSSAVHRSSKESPSNAAAQFTQFINRRDNSSLAAACSAGRCAIIYAGAATHAFGDPRVFAEQGSFRPLTVGEISAADAVKAEFERFVGLEWNTSVTRNTDNTNTSVNVHMSGTITHTNPCYVGARGAAKPQLDEVV